MRLIDKLRKLDLYATDRPWSRNPLAPESVQNQSLECWIPQTEIDAELIAIMRNTLPLFLDLFYACAKVRDELPFEIKEILEKLCKEDGLE